MDISEVTGLELEYEDENVDLKPHVLLGEGDGSRGRGQTSPDIAVKFRTSDERKGIFLLESKFTEHSFYVCSAYRKRTTRYENTNHDKNRCLNAENIVASEYQDCQQSSWGRKYWNIHGPGIE